MAQFGGKNPPWAREVVGQPGVAMVGNLAGGQVLSQPGVATSAVYSLGAAQPQHQFAVQQGGVPGLQGPMMHPQAAAAAALQQSVQLPQPGIAIPTTLATTQVATVSYPAPRATAQGPQPKQRVFTGTVTKLHDNFGFVDEDVFFQTSCVKGNIPKVGDRVLVEAAYNGNMPFKWNATRIQVLPNQPPPGSNPPPVVSQSLSAQPRAMPSGISVSQMAGAPPPLMGSGPHSGMGGRGPGRDGGSGPSSGYRDRDRGHDRDRPRSHRSERRSPPPRRRSRSPRRRSRSPSRATRSSPPRSRRAPRVVPRYTVQIPKLSLDMREANVIILKSRYNNMYIPSDFFNTSFSWTDAFPAHRPLQLGQPCTFHVMHKEVDPIVKHDSILEPPDADHLFSAKVMLMSSPILEELFHKSCALAEDSTEVKEAFQHPTRLIQFLVGLKGKSEPMAIGGPWSPSIDGPNPAEDPRVLINTAIRTTNALTGIDLSVCTQWYRFAEIRYHRPEEVHKGRVVPARVETVVIFLPDAWSCNPSRLEWEQMTHSFKKQLADKLLDENKDETQEEDEEGEDCGEEKKEPLHFSELDPKTMKVNDLRRELEARTLSSKGLKSQLIARLTKALKSEQEKEEQEADNKDEEEKPVEVEEKVEIDEKEEERKRREEEERKRREEREKAARERRYQLPDNPTILVHPSATAKGGKFDCTVMSLSVLLDYRPDDNKEHTFEVSLFAELFNEMLMRDSGFRIYKALLAAPEKVKEEKKEKKESEKDKEKDKKEDKDEKDDKKEKKEKEDEEPPSKKRKSSHDDDKEKDKKEEDKEKKEKEKAEDDDDDENDDDDKSTTTSDGKKDRRRSSKEKEKEKKREKVKYYTAEPDLLLACVYFDQSHTGYLLDKDAEEILHTLGLHLSRAQIKKLIQKLLSRDTLNYRKLTDKPVPKEKKDGESETVSEEDASKIVNSDIDDEILALGNKPLLISPKKEIQSLPSTPRSSKRKKDDETVVQQGMVLYKGAMIDISSVMHRLDKSEKTKRDTETKLKDTQEEMDMLKSSFTSSEQNSQKVAMELQELKKKLRDQRKATDRHEQESKRYHDTLVRAKGPISQLLLDIKDVIAADSSSSSSSSIKSEIKTEVNGE